MVMQSVHWDIQLIESLLELGACLTVSRSCLYSARVPKWIHPGLGSPMMVNRPSHDSSLTSMSAGGSDVMLIHAELSQTY